VVYLDAEDNFLALKKEVFDLDPYYLVLLVVPIIESIWGLLAILFLPLNLLLFAMHLNFLEEVHWVECLEVGMFVCPAACLAMPEHQAGLGNNFVEAMAVERWVAVAVVLVAAVVVVAVAAAAVVVVVEVV